MKIKLFINNPKENWVVDNFINEFKQYTSLEIGNNVFTSNVVWIISPWTWKTKNNFLLKNKKVVCTVHHIDLDKFDSISEEKFKKLDRYIDIYHVISDQTEDTLKKFTTKPTINIPFWIDQSKFFYIENKTNLFKKFDLDENKYFIGSFQRDSEGFDTSLPKLSKGPDRLLKIINELSKKNNNINVILSGYRRDFLIHNLKKMNIEYKYFQNVNFEELNELYNILDLYIVSSRVEGGPRAIFESAITKTPIISTNVGYASKILSKSSIFDMQNFHSAIPDVSYAFNKVQEHTLPNGLIKFDNMLKKLYES